MSKIYDAVVIGAGPSGLAFCSQFTGKFLLVDMGKAINQRDHDDQIDSLVGAGGAGLFSDGKYSFWPAGTAVWDLPNIKDVYVKLTEDIKKYIPKMPDFMQSTPQIINQSSPQEQSDKNWALKEYPCFYIPLDKRKEQIENMCQIIPQESLLFQHQVVCCEKINDIGSDTVYLVTICNLITKNTFQVNTRNIVCAGGRFFQLYMKEISITQKIFRRIEYGVRIVAKKENKTMNYANIDLLDPKYIRKCVDVEYRTFCWCLDAETVLTNHLGIRTYSGRADCPPTGKSNFGFNARIKTEELFDVDVCVEKLRNIEEFELPINELDLLVNYYGEIMGKILIDGISSLVEKYPDLNSDIKLLGPTIEGVGYYPDIDSNLKVRNENIYCIGDNSGIFRGIIASMLSGYWLSNHFTDKTFKS